VASSRRARAKTQEIWRTLCATLQTDPLFKNVPPEFHLHFLELFGHGYRTGHLSKSGNPVRAHTVETALGDVGAFFTGLDRPDPRLEPGTGKLRPQLKKWLVGLHKMDPASSRTYPCTVAILRALFRLPNLTPGEIHARDLAVIGFYYMNRPGEVVKTTSKDSGRSSPFTIADVSFVRNSKRLHLATHHAGILNDENKSKKQKTLTGSTESTLTYSDQKNCHKGEKVSHVPTGDPDICPTRALERVITRLLQHDAPATTPLHAFYDGAPLPKGPAKRANPRKAGKRAPVKAKRAKKALKRHVTTQLLTKLLQRAAQDVEHRTGIPHKKITSRSLRPGGATALLCAGEEPINIALVGRWRSEAMLRYLRAQTTPSAKQFAKLMLQHGDFTYTHSAETTATSPAEFFGIPNEVRPELTSRFDPSDDASDIDEPDFAQPARRKAAPKRAHP
jgi:hypothetical protein